MCASDFRRMAREALTGKWGLALGTGLVAALLGGTIGSGGFSFDFKINLEEYFSYGDLESFLYSDTFRHLIPLFIAAAVIAAIWSLVWLVIGGAVSLGYALFNLNLVDG